jgi:hypothetical protein
MQVQVAHTSCWHGLCSQLPLPTTCSLVEVFVKLVIDVPAVKLSAQVKQAVLEVEEYIRRENWPAIPQDIMKVRFKAFLHPLPSFALGMGF